MICHKCGIQLDEEYLGEENRKKRLCSPCLDSADSWNLLCYCGHSKKRHRLDGKGECKERRGRECGCERFQETSLLEAIQANDKRLVKKIEALAELGQVVRVM